MSRTHERVRLHRGGLTGEWSAVRVNQMGVITDRWPIHPDDQAVLNDRWQTAAAERDALAARMPCDGGCNYGDGPMEECSRHGRPPAEVWQIVTEVQAQRDALAARLAAVEARIANAHAFLDAEDAASEAKGRQVWSIETSLVRAALAAPTDTTKEN